MVETYKIAAYTRISVDIEVNRDNTSIENQKAIIAEYCKLHFPSSTVDYFDDRDHSGYTFEQRPGYMQLRPMLMAHRYDILIVKDLSRFSRRTGKGLAEFEDLIESDLRIIAIGDGVDYPTKDDWMKIKLYFFVNEMPVTDASNKVISVINNRQSKGEWICSVPYGYVITNSKKMTFEVDEPAAEVVREVFRLYTDGWGYKKIANYLTDKHIPTPRMTERARKEAEGADCRVKAKSAWSIVTIAEMLPNDFYIGTLRQHKYHRKKINGADMVLDESEHIVFENNHPPIVDYRLFAAAKEQLKTRTNSTYRGSKKYDNTYSGLMFCGDCGSPMFALSRKDLAEAYTCGTYHQRGKAGCTSHHIRADLLDRVVKAYVGKLKSCSQQTLEILQQSIDNEKNEVQSSACASEEIQTQIDREREELKALIRQKARDILHASGSSEVIEQTYDALIEEAQNRISGYENQLRLAADERNTVIRVNRIAKTVTELLDEIIEKPKLRKSDLNLIIDRIIVFEDHIEIKLKSDIDELLRTGSLSVEQAANFNSDTENIENNDDNLSITVAQVANKQKDKVFGVNVISNGDPLEIFTERDGTVIFRKYSPVGELSAYAGSFAETVGRALGCTVAVTDKDSLVAVYGEGKKELLGKELSPQLEKLIENRREYSFSDGGEAVYACDSKAFAVKAFCPVIADGDASGSVLLLASPEAPATAADAVRILSVSAKLFSGQLCE